jgi:flagellar hook-length control protein FliK
MTNHAITNSFIPVFAKNQEVKSTKGESDFRKIFDSKKDDSKQTVFKTRDNDDKKVEMKDQDHSKPETHQSTETKESKEVKESKESTETKESKEPKKEEKLNKKDVAEDAKDQDQKAEGPKKVEEAIKKIAQILDMNPGQLNSLLNTNGIHMQDILNESVESLTQKISNIIDTDLGANNDILKQIQDVLQEMKDSITTKNVQQENQDPAENSSIENTTTINTISTKEDDLPADTKVIKKDEIDNQKPEKQAASVQANEPKKIGPEQKVDSAKAQDQKENDVHTVMKKEQPDMAGENSRENQNPGQLKDKVKVINLNGYRNENKIDSGNENFFQNNLINDIKQINAAQKISKPEIIVNKEEVLKQIVDKASVTLSGDKAEMVMKLKPESLGNVSLKIVTERGMVTAQIVAENQKVKEVIEANLNMLKDSLEKQGMTVQQFSVSVGQDSFHRGFNQNAFLNNSGQYGRNKNQGNEIAGVMGIPYISQERTESKILWPNSTINYTA